MDGAGPQPLAHYLSRLCEEFPGKLPTEILAEQGRLPFGLLEEIIEARAYAGTKASYDASQQGDGYVHPLLQLVQEIESELVVEDLARKEAES